MDKHEPEVIQAAVLFDRLVKSTLTDPKMQGGWRPCLVSEDELKELRSILEDLRAGLTTEYGPPTEEIKRFEEGMAILARCLGPEENDEPA